MHITRKQLTIFSALLLSTILLMVAGTVLLNKFLHLDTYKEELLSQLQKSLNRNVTYVSGDFSFAPQPTFTFSGVAIKEPDGNSTFLYAAKLACKVELLPLIQKKVVLKEITADTTVINLKRDQPGRFNISDLLEQKAESVPVRIHKIWMSHGTINFVDQFVTPQGLTTIIKETDLYISNPVRGERCEFKISASIGKSGGEHLIIGGQGRIAEKNKPLTDSSLEIKVISNHLDSEHFWPYYKGFVPFQKSRGYIDIDTSFKGKISAFTSSGKIRVSDLLFDYRPIFKSILTPKDLHFNYELELTKSDVLVKSLDLTLDGLNVKGSCGIREIPGRDPRITAKAKTSTFNLENFHQYIPYGIIPKDTADWIEQHIKGGIYRLDDGRLDGRASQIAHMELGENYNVLYIKGRIEKGLVSYGSRVPTFNSIKGELEMKGKDFNLNKTTGNFGESPFNLEGKVADYPLVTPSSYPFSMRIIPHQPEIIWLLGKEHGDHFSYDGKSVLQLTGTGQSSSYSLAAEWDLTKSSYNLPGLIKKPADHQNVISAKGVITPRDAKINSLQLSLAPLTLSMNAVYPYASSKDLSLSFRTNQFPIQDIAPLIAPLAKYEPSGKLQANIQGTIYDKKNDENSWNGTVKLSGTSLKPSPSWKPLSGLDGVVNFRGNSMETSLLSGKLGTSSITVKGSYSESSAMPATNLVFSSPLLDISDIGLSYPDGIFKIAKIKGDISMTNNNLTVRSLSGQINKTSLWVKGTVKDIRRPAIDLSVASSYLDINDVIALGKLSLKNDEHAKNPIALNASLTAETGNCSDIPFEKLQSSISLENNILYLQTVEANTLGGKIAGKGRIDFLSTPTRHQYSFNIRGAASDKAAQALGVKKHEITGTLSAQGDLNAKGTTSVEIKKSILGSVSFKTTDGTLRRFSVLSKIFSILNISQLLKFQLPDMVSGGMPYKEITATASIQDGILSTSDLYVKSNSINISAVGKLDMNKEELDFTIGAQPLQTVDKIVSKIPIVGWILTGKEKSLITTYFEAKGKIADPKVSSIPVKSMARGMLDIFKRMFQLPQKLFTDSGEVIMGK